MNADLKPGNLRVAKVTGAMLLREFLTLRVLHFKRARALCGSLEMKKTRFV